MNETERSTHIPGIKITDQMLAEIRSRYEPGDYVEVMVRETEEGNQKLIKREICEITGVYRHLFAVRREAGWIESFTWVDLIRQNGVREL